MCQVFDVIFAGGGTTACVVAGRLASMDPLLKILVLESGQHSCEVPRHVQPCRYAENLAPDSTTSAHYIGKQSAHFNGRSAVVSCGQGVGGGSAINFMLYVRGAASDYDDWAAFGNEGWSFNELLPFIRKLETFNPISNRSATHGYSGPIQVSAGGFHFGVGNQFLNVARVYDPERPHVDDSNDFFTSNAYGPAYQWVFIGDKPALPANHQRTSYIDPITGRRSDAASRYLYPHRDNPNLTIMVGKRVKRVIVENGCAVGVEYMSDEKASGAASSELAIAKANKLVVVSAGAFGSPAILERSGIGARSVLKKHNVFVQVDLPGVGENYLDHLGAYPLFYASDETEVMDDVWHGSGARDAQLKEWGENGTGKIAHSGIAILAKLRPTDDQLASADPALQRRWETFFKPNSDKPMSVLLLFAGFPLRPSLPPARKVLSSLYYVMYPDSIGSVHISSREDLYAPLDFDPNFFASEGDIAQLTLWYKFTRELIRRMPAYRGEVADFHPKFPSGSPAACKETDVPVSMDAPDIVYSSMDDEAIVRFHRNTTISALHPLGTCAMKPRDQGGVVDARLNVYGVEGLKVADLSICPSNVGNNTYSTALLIGEKAAAIFAEDLGYKGV